MSTSSAVPEKDVSKFAEGDDAKARRLTKAGAVDARAAAKLLALGEEGEARGLLDSAIRFLTTARASLGDQS